MIKELSSLRSIFIIIIFLHHMSVFPGGGGMGVAFFFILGGFAMTIGYHEKVMSNSFNYCSYIARRVIKFYPLHWLCLLAFLPIVTKGFSWQTFILNAALIHSWIPDGRFFFSYNDVSWYLADTVFFATVFPFVFRFIERKSTQQKIILGGLLLMMYGVIVAIMPRHYCLALLYINPLVRLFDFILGIYLGLLFFTIRKDERAKLYVFNNKGIAKFIVYFAIVLLLIQTVLLQGKTNSVSAYYWPLIFVIIIGTSIISVFDIQSVFKNKLLVKFGEYSFSFFMLHKLVIIYVYKIIRPNLLLCVDNRYILQVLLIVICFIVTLIATVLVQNYFVNPITQWLTKKIQPSTIVQ